MTHQTTDANIRPVDFKMIAALPEDQKYIERILDRSNGATDVTVSLIRTPAGGGSAEGLHYHEFEQVFYLIEGTMTIEVSGETSTAGPGSVIVFPKGVHHRNWNGGDVPTLHLAVAAPAPPIGQTGTHRVAAGS